LPIKDILVKKSLFTNYLINTHDLSKNKSDSSINFNNFKISNCKKRNENSIKEKDFRTLTINNLTNSTESTNKRFEIKKLFYHKKNIQDLSSGVKLVPTKIENNNKKNTKPFLNSNISIRKSKMNTPTINKINNDNFITINKKKSSLYDSNINLNNIGLKNSLEKIKNKIKKDSNPDIIKGFNSIKEIGKIKKGIYRIIKLSVQ